MDLVYLDESGDVIYTESKGTRHFALSAFIVPEESWNETFNVLKKFRKYLLENYNIPLYKELHARDFLNGRGRPSKDQIIRKFDRVEITRMFFQRLAHHLSELNIYVINVCVPNKSGVNSYDTAVDRILNRIQRTLKMKKRQAVLIFDEGKEQLVKRLYRKMRVYNPVPSQFGAWEDGSASKSILTDRIIADPFFRSSKDDYFIQTVDFIAFTLLKSFEPPTPHVEKYQINKLFTILEPILFKQASKYNKLGIVTR